MNRFFPGSEQIQARQGTKTRDLLICCLPKTVYKHADTFGVVLFFFYCVIRKLSLKYFNVINTTYPTSSIYYIHQKPSRKISETSCETTAINQNFGERFILSVCNVSKYKIKHV